MNTYPKSTHRMGDTSVSIARGTDADVLIISGPNPGFVGVKQGDIFVAPQSHVNAVLLRQLFPFTAPQPILTKLRTIGVGDRLGIATPGHIRLFERYDALPVLAQQSIRELNLTNRSYADVLDAATFAVYREDYQLGFGADGDHLKTDEEVKYALDSDFSIITLDCSEHIRNDVLQMCDAEVDAAYVLDAELEALYCEKSFGIEGNLLYFTQQAFRRTALIYGAALNHAIGIYQRHIEGRPGQF